MTRFVCQWACRLTDLCLSAAMGLNVFTPGNVVLCWVAMAAQLTTQESALASSLVRPEYESFAGDKPFHILEKHFQSL